MSRALNVHSKYRRALRHARVLRKLALREGRQSIYISLPKEKRYFEGRKDMYVTFKA